MKMKYKNNTKSDLTFADGKTLEAYNVAEVDPKTVVEKGWVSSGMIEAIEKSAPAKAPAKAEAKTASDKK